MTNLEKFNEEIAKYQIPDAQEIAAQFTSFASQVEDYKKKAEAIQVYSIHDKAEIEEAKKLHKELVSKRTSLKKIHDDLKRESLQRGKLIDGIYNIAVALLAPVEEDLKQKKDYIKIQEEKLKKELLASRQQIIAEYLEEGESYPENLEDLSEEMFETVRMGLKAKKDNRELEAKMQAEKEEKEKQQIIEAKARALAEKQSKEKELQLEVERQKQQRERQELERKTIQLEAERQKRAKEIAEEEKRLGELRQLLPVLRYRDGKRHEDNVKEIYTVCVAWIETLSKVKVLIDEEI